MLFNSFQFIMFFVVVFAVHWYVLKRQRHRVVWLLASSFVFYGAWSAQLVLLLLAVIGIAYGAALLLDPARGLRRRGFVLGVAVAALLGILAHFKYLGFLSENLQLLMGQFGMKLSWPTLNIILPVGISFYVFQAISYVADVYRGRLPARRDAIDVAFYVSFFPQLVAGPILRASQFFPQITRSKVLTGENLSFGVKMIFVGVIYKAILADSIASQIDPVFKAPDQWSGTSLWIASLGFGAQIYFDFAGYSTMAIGFARLLGYRVPRNFNFPYSRTNITDFWRNWHISLSRWLRDYLFISLGGSRAGRSRYYLSLLTTMVLGGLWHGASFNFLIWGGLHGVALCMHKVWKGVFGAEVRPPFSGLPWVVFSWFATQVFVFLCWVPFRAQNLGDTRTVLGRMFLGSAGPGTSELGTAGLELSTLHWSLLLLLVPLAVDQWLGVRRGFWIPGRGAEAPGEYFVKASSRTSTSLVAFLLGFLVAVYLTLVPVKSVPFIYFQF
jgi:D-alanyl-lipoteichoic acid acyltransferase DltB (MBOAT superfamily)